MMKCGINNNKMRHVAKRKRFLLNLNEENIGQNIWTLDDDFAYFQIRKVCRREPLWGRFCACSSKTIEVDNFFESRLNSWFSLFSILSIDRINRVR